MTLQSTVELQRVAQQLANELVKTTSKIPQLMGYQLSLLEVFKKEYQKLEAAQPCDPELAYVAYKAADLLCSYSEREGTTEFLQSLRATISAMLQKVKTLTSQLGVDEDPLLARLAGLKGAKVTEHFVTPQELRQLLSPRTLLIDNRLANLFEYSHINHENCINISPKLVDFSVIKNETDLESILRLHLPRDQLTKFEKRAEYDHVVLYDTRYRPHAGKFVALKELVVTNTQYVAPTASTSTVTQLAQLLKLKHSPKILLGGLEAWHAAYGPDSLTRRDSTPGVISKPPASLSRHSSIHTKPKEAPAEPAYLRNFGEYISLAKNDVTPMAKTTSTEDGYTGLYIRPPSYKPLSGPDLAPSLPSQQTPPQQPPHKRNSLTRTLSQSFRASPEPKQTSPDLPKFLNQFTTGLTNLGNSCYMNCVLQCLAATPQLTKFFFPTVSSSASASGMSLQSYRQHINLNNKLGTQGILTTNFVKLLSSMLANAGRYFTPLDFKKVAGSLSPGQQFASFDQQDCLEFLNFVLDGLHEDLNQMSSIGPEEKRLITELTPEQEKTREFLPVRLASTIEWERYLKLNFSIVVDFFQGQYLLHLRCLECNFTSTTYNAFSILSLPIPQKLGKTQVSLDDCLEEFTTTELLDDNNKWHCPQCRRFTRLTKKIQITRLPEVLIIHFKRFEISPTGYFTKLDTFVKYPVNDVLDLTSYWPDVGTVINDHPVSMNKEKEAQILSSLPTRNQVAPFRYKLYGVANHFGNLTTGHYTAYVHKASDAKKAREWCYFDDAKITYNCKESQVLNKNAYCLFYQRVY